LLEGPVHWRNQNFGYALGVVILVLFVVIVAAGISVRFCVAFATGRLNKPVPREAKAQVRAYRRVAIVMAGGVLGLVLAMSLATLLAGTAGGWYLDLGVAMVAAGAAIAALRLLPVAAAWPAAALYLALALIAAIGSGQSGRIVRQAEAYAKGRPWCLVGPGRTPPITSTLQLGFFSLPKAEGYPHLAVRVQDGEEVDEAHWSIRNQRIEAGWGTDVPACRPRKDYGTALRNGELEVG